MVRRENFVLLDMSKRKVKSTYSKIKFQRLLSFQTKNASATEGKEDETDGIKENYFNKNLSNLHTKFVQSEISKIQQNDFQ